jgi:hypothetical protein
MEEREGACPYLDSGHVPPRQQQSTDLCREEGERWRTHDHSWFETEAIDGGEIFFMNTVLACEMEPDEEEDDETYGSVLDRLTSIKITSKCVHHTFLDCVGHSNFFLRRNVNSFVLCSNRENRTII